MVSLFGVVALSGIIVNDTVVLLDEANRRLDSQHPVDAIRKRSLQLYEALTEAASVRFRAVVLTSLTTFFGVAPLMLDSSPAVQLFIPLGVSLGFGVLAATAVTLLVLPALYLVVEDVAELFRSSDRFGE
jgi:multidrug efflux pump subunit AcrB